MKRLFVCLACCSALWAQSVVGNADLIKLSQAGMSDDFIVNVVNQEGSWVSSEVPSLVELRNAGVSEKVLSAVLRKRAPREAINSDSVVSMSKAGLSDNFILSVMTAANARFEIDTNRMVELRREGVSEKVLTAMIGQPLAPEIPAGTSIHVRLIESVDSDKQATGHQYRATLHEPIVVNGETIAPKGADAIVRLAEEKQAGRISGKTELKLELASVTVGRKIVPIESTSVAEYSGSQTAKTAKTAAAVGAIGAIIGGIAGGGKGAAIGAASGGAAGAGAAAVMKGPRVHVASEALLTFTTERPARTN